MVGCTAKPSPTASTSQNAEQTYANANKEILSAFGTTLKQIAARPIPKPPKGASKRERREVYARALEPITGTAANALTELDRLMPPPSMRPVHDATRSLLITYRDDNAAYVAAIRKGNRQEADALSSKFDADTLTSMAKLRAILIEGLMREGKTRQQAEEQTKNLAL